MADALDELYRRHGLDYRQTSCVFKIIPTRSGFGYGYLRVGDEGLFNVILGLNPNGSERRAHQ